MKEYRIDIILFLGIFLTSSFFSYKLGGPEGIDIQLHDTYFVIDNFSMVVVMLGPLLSVIFLLRSLLSRFANILSNTFLILGFIFLAMISYNILIFQYEFLDQIKQIVIKPDPFQKSYIDVHKKGINLSYSFLIIICLGIILLAFRTITLLRKKRNLSSAITH